MTALSEDLFVQIKEDLTRHEGCKTTVYLCTENIPTIGIGHALIGIEDLAVGDEVSMEQVLEWFKEDCDTAVKDCCAVFLNFASLPDQVKRVLVNMAFNLGRNRLSKFKKMITAVNEGNYQKAADEMIDSKWYRQVGRRSEELVEIMRGAKTNG